MNTPLVVMVDCDNQLEARALVASFPISLRCTDGPGASLAIIDGNDWPLRGIAAIEKGISRVLVLNPSLHGSSDAQRLAEAVKAADARLVLADAIGGHPAVSDFREVLHSDATVVTLNGYSRCSVQEIVFAQLRVARALGISITSPAPICQTNVAATGTLSATLNDQDIALHITATRSEVSGSCYDIHVLGAGHAGMLRLPSANIARPAVVEWVDEAGHRRLPEKFEAPYRAALQRLLTDAPDATAPVIDEWLADLDLAKILTARAQ